MKIFIFLYVIIMFFGCVPMVYGPYYQPLYDDRSVTTLNGVCSGKGNFGPSTGIEFAIPGGIVVDFRTSNRSDLKRDMFSVILKIPSGVDAQFLSNEIKIIFPDGTINKQIQAMNLHGTSRVTPSMIFQMEKFCPVSTAKENNDMSAQLWSWSKNIDVTGSFTQLDMTLPMITVNGKPLKLNPITIYPYHVGTNKYSDESYKACQKLSPTGRCVMSYITYAKKFEALAEPFNLSGRAYWIQEESNNHIEVNLDFKTNTNAILKFDTDTLKFQNKTNDSQISTKLDFVDVIFENRSLPMTTPIKALHSNIVLLIDGTIDTKKHQNLDIYLPPILINGNIYKFKPIHLKHIILDGGIVPFNC